MSLARARTLGALCLFALACGEEPATQVIVVVRSELSVGTELTEVNIEVKGATGEPIGDHRTFALAAETGHGKFALPLSFVIVPSKGQDDGRFRLVVRGLDETGMAVIEQQIIASFQTGRTVLLSVYLPRRCLQVLCRTEQESEDVACRQDTGLCEPIEEQVELPVVVPGDEISAGEAVSCGIGLRPSVEGVCKDIDECAIDNGGCGDTPCENAEGSYACGDCEPGFGESAGGHCVDIDECLGGTAHCSGGTLCRNVLGSFVCVCPVGFELDGDSCEDIDECADDNGGCGAADCHNSAGSHACGACEPGFGEDASGACLDLDECTSGSATCGDNSHCTNTEGGFTCDCDTGFEPGVEDCTDVDECALDNGGCGTMACINERGSHTCSTTECARGFDDCDAEPGCETNVTFVDRCGSCDARCEIANAVVSCDTGVCEFVSCDDGFGDCNDDLDDGCETSLDQVGTCGSCDTSCSVGAPLCSGRVCTDTVCSDPNTADCDQNGSCEVNLSTSVANCGGCNARCEFSVAEPNAQDSPVCTDGHCQPACDTLFGNCNNDYRDGCERSLREPSDCGSCGTPCAIANATESCATGQCRVDQCAPDWADCNSDATSCETQLGTLMNCTDCGNACSLPNAVPTCAGSAGTHSCAISACQPNFADCDTTASTGCEIDKRTSARNCGSCGNDCTMHPHVQSASCGNNLCNYSCASNFGNCTGAPGCETPLTTLTDCGACGIGCSRQNGNATCSTGSCRLADCSNGFDNCDGNEANGCEPLNTLQNCGACGDPCGVSNGTGSCASGSCRVVSCSNGFNNCDGVDSNGCEPANADSDGDGTPNCQDGCPLDGRTTVAPCGFVYVPHNFEPGHVSFATAPSSTLNCGATTIDTSGSVTITNWCGTAPVPVVQPQDGGLDVVIIPLKGLTVASGATLRLIGTRPVILAVQGDVRVAGAINARGQMTSAGAGGNQQCPANAVGGTGQSSGGFNAGGGGGGGGAFGNGGGRGGNGDSGGQGGATGTAHGSDMLTPLRGGCAGGRGGNGDGTGGPGGVAGGAVQLTVSGTLVVANGGSISASGGAGLAGSTNEDGGGGGGSGGGVLLEAGTLTLESGSWVTANGGGGASGAGSNSNNSSPGTDGYPNRLTRAAGGTGLEGAGSGGGGGAQEGGAQNGADGQPIDCILILCTNGAGGGGGGGGAGRVYLRGASSCAVDPGTTSPAATTSCP